MWLDDGDSEKSPSDDSLPTLRLYKLDLWDSTRLPSDEAEVSLGLLTFTAFAGPPA